MKPFVYNSLATRVIFGRGTVNEIDGEAQRLGCRRLILLSTPSQEGAAHRLRDLIGEKVVGVFAGAAMHTPVHITENAMEHVHSLAADGVVALGGGSTVGLAKAIAFRTDLPQIAVPTTYAGSEMTPILGETLNEVKTTKSSPRILPETVIYDVDLTLKLSSSVSVTSGFNAVAHAVEALYAKERNPVISMIAEEGIKAVLRGLPSVVADGSDIGGRTDALYGAWLCGICLGSVGMALHHKLCHTLGGTFGLAHADIHTIVLPHALAYNWTACADAFDGLRGILGNNPPQALQRLAAKLGGPTALRDLGMPAEGIERAADLALANPYWNPRPLEKKSIRKLLEGAWAGDPPLFEG